MVALDLLVVPLLPLVVGEREGVGTGEPVLGVAAGPPLGQEVLEEGGDEGELGAGQLLLLGVVPVEKLDHHHELRGRLGHPLDVAYVPQDGLPQRLVHLPSQD